MKQLFTLSIIILVLFLALPTLATEEDAIVTLDDGTPSIDVVITLPPDTTGTIGINLESASVSLKDEANNVVFHTADERLHALELHIAANSGQHILSVERLPGVTESYVSITGLADLTMNGSSEQASDMPITFNQNDSLQLEPNNPGGLADVSIPADETGVITTLLFGLDTTTQLVDNNGVLIAESVGGHVDGISLLIDGGAYHMTILANNLSESVLAGVRVMPTDEAGFVVLNPPEIAAAETTTDSPEVSACNATVAVSSVNLRSGPGTGYSVLEYGYHNETYPVGGQNSNGSWVVVGTDDGSAWVYANAIQLQGNCSQLTVFDIPYREAQAPQVIFTSPEQTVASPQVIIVPAAPAASTNNSSSSHHEDDHDEHEGHDDDD